MLHRNDFGRPGSFQTFPPVVKSIMIVNGLMFLISLASEKLFGFELSQILGLHNFASPLFKPVQLVSHLFMHGGFMHIIMNMLSLWMFGSVIENYWGGKRFFVYYFITGFGAAFIHLLFSNYDYHQMTTAVDAFAQNPDLEQYMAFVKKYVPDYLKAANAPFGQIMEEWQYNNPPGIAESAKQYMHELLILKRDTPTVGASGAVFGVLLAFGIMFPEQTVFLMFFPMPAKYLVIVYGGFELYSGIQNDPTSNVAHFAHLGGMLFGYILIKYWQRKGK